jgi:hypothetical protein
MAGIIVLFELEQPQAESPEGGEPALLLAHAAGQDTEIPEDPLPRTLCGKDTEPMEHFHYRLERPGEPWCPSELGNRRCRCSP